MISTAELFQRHTEIEQEAQPNHNFIVGQAAQDLDKQWQLRHPTGDGIAFLEEFIVKMDELDLPSVFTQPRGSIQEKRQPSFVEAVKETTKRLKIIDHMTATLPDSVQGVVYGGSMSYGRFYNVRGGEDASDIDIFFIVDPDFFTDADAQAFFDPTKGFDAQEADEVTQRMRYFPSLSFEYADMMSHKLTVDSVVISAKFLPITFLVDEFIETPYASMTAGNDNVQAVRDYKQGPYSMQIFTQYNFAHEPGYFTISENYFNGGKTVVTNIPAHIMHNGHFFTGDHQNHFLPDYGIAFDRYGSVQKTLQEYQAMLKTRCDQEKVLFNSPELHVINAQDRRDVWSPQMLEQAQRRFT